MTSVTSQYLDYRPRVHTVQREGDLVLVRLPGPGRHLALLHLPVLAAQLRVLLLHVLLGDVQQDGFRAVGAPTCALHHDSTNKSTIQPTCVTLLIDGERLDDVWVEVAHDVSEQLLVAALVLAAVAALGGHPRHAPGPDTPTLPLQLPGIQQSPAPLPLLDGWIQVLEESLGLDDAS